MKLFIKDRNREIAVDETLSLKNIKQLYRSFKTKEECFEEMLKHQPFGWVRYDDSITAIINIAPDGITVNNGIETSSFYFEECLLENINISFVDGIPFGIKI